MIIDFSKIDLTVLKNFKDGEKEFRANMFTDDAHRIMQATLIPGASIGMHAHESGSEIIYILSGSGKMLYEGTEERLEAGMCHYCPTGCTHSLINDGEEDLNFFAVVTF